MFEFVRKHTRILQFVLVLLIFPSFVFFGIQGYSRFTDGSRSPAAKVDGHEITQTEWDNAYRQQVDRVRAQMPNVDPSLLDTPEMKRSVLEGLLRERVMQTAADKLHLAISDQQLVRLMSQDPSLASVRKPDGTIDRSAYLQLLAANGLTPQAFEAHYSIAQVLGSISGSTIAPLSATGEALDAMFQQREVQLQRFDTKDYLSKVNPTDAELQAYYKDPKNSALFQAPEQAGIDYVVLDLDAISKGITIPEEELKAYYTANAETRFSTPAERRASHILIKADKSASPEVKAKAKAKAEALLAEVKKNPGSFAELAKKNSDDPGSAEKGGDLDFFGRGAMVKPFEDAAFSLKPGEISGIIESDFGYHIIKVTDARGGDKKSYEAVRSQIEADAKKQEAQKRYADAAVQFSNLVEDQSDSLKPVADKLKLDIRTATVQRQPAPGATGPLANPKLLAAVFGTDSLRDKRNTQAIETASNQMVSAHVTQFSPAHVKPFSEVAAQVREAVVKAAAAELARKDGQTKLAAGQKDAATSLSGATATVSRAQPGEVPQTVLDAVLKANADKLPAWVGVDLGSDGYQVARIVKVLGRDPIAADPKKAQAQYGQAWANAETQAYYAALKARYKATILAKPSALSASAAESTSQ